jgi:hypothetical protein
VLTPNCSNPVALNKCCETIELPFYRLDIIDHHRSLDPTKMKEAKIQKCDRNNSVSYPYPYLAPLSDSHSHMTDVHTITCGTSQQTLRHFTVHSVEPGDIARLRSEISLFQCATLFSTPTIVTIAHLMLGWCCCILLEMRRKSDATLSRR